MKPCPFCNTEIQGEAIRCKACKADLTSAAKCPFCAEPFQETPGGRCPHCQSALPGIRRVLREKPALAFWRTAVGLVALVLFIPPWEITVITERRVEGRTNLLSRNFEKEPDRYFQQTTSRVEWGFLFDPPRPYGSNIYLSGPPPSGTVDLHYSLLAVELCGVAILGAAIYFAFIRKMSPRSMPGSQAPTPYAPAS